MASADLLLHPVRLRIVKAFLGDRTLTTGQLGAELPDVPAGTLYRHVALLNRAGVLEVVAERRVRGAIERTYAMRLAAARAVSGQPQEMSADDDGHAFLAYVAGMLANADRYLASVPEDRANDGASYQVGALWLTDAELEELASDMAAVLRARLANHPGDGRRRRMLYTVVLPEPEQAADGRGPERPFRARSRSTAPPG